MVVHYSAMSKIIREGMDDYWRVVRSPTDDGLTDYELGMKRQYERDLTGSEEKFGADFDRIFGEAS